jgi:subtilisin family serine protease
LKLSFIIAFRRFFMTAFLKFIYCFALLLFFGVQLTLAQYNSEVFVEGELLVKYKTGTKSASARSMNAQTGAAVVEEFPDLGWQRVKLPADGSIKQALSFYKSSAAVESVQPNFYYHLLNTSNDTRFAELYAMQKISATSAWDLSTGSATTVVANIDTGIAYNHEDLAPNMWHNPGEIPANGVDDDGNGFVDDYYGYDFFYNDSDPIDDAGGHGTHTSGTIGAVGNNSLGVVGVSWNVRLMAIKIYSQNGFDTTSAQLINAYNYVRMMKQRGVNIRVTNNSYGGCGEACSYDQATKDAIDALGSTGVLQVFAAGNAGNNVENIPFYPASYTSPSILAVAASDADDNRVGFSNYGAIGIDLAAPGFGILSTFNSSNNSYVSLSGTSMAAPHVSGAAALLASYNPNLSAASLKASLMNSVDALAQWNGVVKTGGRLNVARALQNPTVCTFTLSNASQSVSSVGGSFSFDVIAPQNCDFSITGNTSWISVTNGNSGSGNGTVNFNVSSNPGAARDGTITVAGQTFTVSQAVTKSRKRVRFI